MSAAVCSRRVSAGLTPPPGSLATAPVWWSSTDWTEFDVRGALTLHRDVCAEHHVAPDTVLAVARGMARFADSVTGRECRPTNERLVDVVRVSLSTVQRARRVLKALGLVVEVTAGRSVMTLAERLKAWDRGSSHRRIAAEFALCSRRDRLPRPVDNRRADLQLVDDDTPPVGQVVRGSATEIQGFLRREDATRKAAPRPAPTEKGRRRPSELGDVRARRLAEAVRRRLGWLRDTSAGRTTPTLTKFAQADWTADDVVLAIRDRLAIIGKTVPVKVDRPWAYLAWLMRDVDPADRPGVLEEFMRETERREREYERLRVYGPPCPHGMPAGDVASPTHATIACPFCRGVPEELAEVDRETAVDQVWTGRPHSTRSENR